MILSLTQGFMEYGIKFVLFSIVVVVAVFTGKKLRERKNAKQTMDEKSNQE